MNNRVLAAVLLTATLVAVFAFVAYSKFGGSESENDSAASSWPKLLVSATWRGEFKEYRSYVLDIPFFKLSEKKPETFDDFSKKVTKYMFPEGYIAQEFCEHGDRRFVAWGKFWTSEDALWTGRIYELTSSWNAIIPRLVDSTKDYRFRDCSFGSSHGKTYLASVTQWDGYLHVIDVETGKKTVRHVPYYGKNNNKVTTMHFVEFADLDADGNDEIYLTATTPEFWRFWNGTGYQEWSLFKWTLSADGTLSEVRDVWDLPWAFVKRVKKISVGKEQGVLVGSEGVLYENGKPKIPFAIYAYYWSENWIPKKRKVLEVPNKECKEFATFSPLGKNVPSFQLGCDNGETYVYEIRGDSIENLSFLERAKFAVNEKVTDNYSAQRDVLVFWDVIQTHAMFGHDFDGDSKDELVLGVNNTWLYVASVKEDGKTDIREIFHIERIFPEPVGRLMIFTATPDFQGLPSEPLIPFSETTEVANVGR